MTDKIAKALNQVVFDLYGINYNSRVFVSKVKGFDYSSDVALKLGKTLHRDPMEVAGEIRDKLDEVYGD